MYVKKITILSNLQNSRILVVVDGATTGAVKRG